VNNDLRILFWDGLNGNGGMRGERREGSAVGRRWDENCERRRAEINEGKKHQAVGMRKDGDQINGWETQVGHGDCSYEGEAL